MASANLVAWRAARTAAPEWGEEEETILALHYEMNRMLDQAGSGLQFALCFRTPAFSSVAPAWSRAEVRAGRIAISKSWHGEGG